MGFSPYELNENTIHAIQREYSSSELPWILGYSGGKDSSALLKLVFLAIMHLEHRPKRVSVVYCDTGVDIPVVHSLVMRTLECLRSEANDQGIPLDVMYAFPRMNDRFFVKVIGRGYPPPTNKFRWCTDKLRIAPVKRALASIGQDRSLILLGIRKGESMNRDRTMLRHETGNEHFFRQSDNKDSLIYSPIVNYSVEEVWNTLMFNVMPKSIEFDPLWNLYKQTSGECPIIRDPKGTPCAKGRFGCWICTVVRRDRAVKALAEDGHPELIPLLNFRNWLMQIRDRDEYRCRRRRNGMVGRGPFTLEARKEILQRLLDAQVESGLSLTSDEELEAINRLWTLDKESKDYVQG